MTEKPHTDGSSVTCHTAAPLPLTLTPGERLTLTEIVGWFPGTTVEAWREDDGKLGLAFTDDGCRMVGYFDSDGHLIGDWIV